MNTLKRAPRWLISFGAVLALGGTFIMLAAGDSGPLRVLGAGIVMLGTGTAVMGWPRRTTDSAGTSHERSTVSLQRAPEPDPGPCRRYSDIPDTHAEKAAAGMNTLPQADLPAHSIPEIPKAFTEWFERRDREHDIWPALDRWLRDTLYQHLEARRVRCFRVTRDNRAVLMANDPDNAFWVGRPPALVEHVITTGRRFVRGADGGGSMIDQLVAKWASQSAQEPEGRALSNVPVWLLPIRHAHRTIGLVVVGELPTPILRNGSTLEAVGDLVELFWRHVDLSHALETAERTDSASGVLNRSDLTANAHAILERSVMEGEPAVLLIMALEGMRRLDDDHQWSIRDLLVASAGETLRQKLRTDDVVGRFSDDLFVAVLRRLDIGLGRLIAEKLLSAVQARIREEPALQEVIEVRCAITDMTASGFNIALGDGMRTLQEARERRCSLRVGGGSHESTVENLAQVRP